MESSESIEFEADILLVGPHGLHNCCTAHTGYELDFMKQWALSFGTCSPLLMMMMPLLLLPLPQQRLLSVSLLS
jgi:hypothetical protein